MGMIREVRTCCPVVDFIADRVDVAWLCHTIIMNADPLERRIY